MPKVNSLDRFKVTHNNGVQRIEGKHSTRNYTRLQKYLDDYVAKNKVKRGQQAITLTFSELYRELELTGNYDLYPANKSLAQQLEEKLDRYVVAFYQKDKRYYYDFVPLPLEQDSQKHTQKDSQKHTQKDSQKHTQKKD